MNKIKYVLLTAGVLLAMAFTFSCSSGDGGDNSGSGCDKGNDIANYKIVSIGNQVWMAENLNYNIKDSKCYDNKERNCDKYGRLYDWVTAMDIDAKYKYLSWGRSDVKHRGICPRGWHIPSKADWAELISYVESDNGCSGCAGRYLRTFGKGVDKYGFSALPGGYGYSDGSFGGGADSVSGNGDWWSSSEIDSDRAYGTTAGPGPIFENISYGYFDKSNLSSIRCVKD